MRMNSRERVMAALKREEPDHVPFCELAVDRFSIVEKPDGAGYPALVSAMNRAVATLSQAMAEQIAVTQTGCE